MRRVPTVAPAPTPSTHGRARGLSISVQEMRKIVLTAARAPSGGRWQVVVVEDADRLTEAAANAR